MPEIIPNLHPLFVHFTVALIVISFLMLMFAWLLKFLKINLAQEAFIVSRWCLWLSAIAAICTVIAGFHAYFSISMHGMNSHMVMVTHRSWALSTLTAVLLITSWSIVRHVKNKHPNFLFSLCMFVPFILVLITGYYGTELVYRYGLGVIPVSKMETKGHRHGSENAEPVNIKKNKNSNKSQIINGPEPINEQAPHGVDDHQH